MMKRSLPPVTSVVFVFAVAAATLCFRIIVSSPGGDSFISRDVRGTQKPPPVFNATLLTFAAVDLADDSLRQDVEQLVDGNFRSGPNNRQRSFLSAGRYRPDIGARSSRGGPINVRSPEFYRLWLDFRRYLRDWWRHRRFEPDVMSNMVNVLKNLESGSKYKTCAVVGNSGILLKSNLGEVIDGHEFVIRLNNARIGGYERLVGSKTSLSFMNSNILHLCSRRGSCFCHPYGERVPIMMYMSQPLHFLDYTVCNSSHKAPLMITDPKLDVLCARIVKYYSVKRYQAEYDLYEDLVKSPEAIPFVSDKFKFPPVIVHR